MMRWLDNCNNRINFPLQIQQYRLCHKRQAIEIKPIQYTGCTKKPQTIENNLLLEFQWPSTKLNPRVHKLLT